MRRILVLAHREELIFQAAAHARKTGLSVGIEMGGYQCRKEDVVISTVQTQTARRKCKSCHGEGCDYCDGRGFRTRMEKFNPSDFGLLIVDEGHHATAKSYRTVLAWYRQNPLLKVLLVTATPKRADGIGLHNVCDSVAYEMDLRTAIEDGWLCPIRQRFVQVDHLDLSQVRTKRGGDLADGELQRAFLGDSTIEEQELLHAIAKPSLDEANGKPLLVFAAGQEHAEKLTAAFNAYDGVTAELVIDKTDKDERRRIIERYKSGETQVLVGCGVFTEGFDAPGTAVVAIARPTKSESLYLQMVGRGTRPLAGTVDGLATAEERRASIAASDKPVCMILDFVGNSGNHKLVSVADVLAGDSVHPLDLAAALREAKSNNESCDMEELIEKAKQAREAKEKRDEERRRERQSTTHYANHADYTAADVDLFGGRGFDPFRDYTPEPNGATQKQVNLLIKLGISPETATGYTRRQASAVIDKKTKATGGEYVVTFGKWAGKRLCEIPRGYVEWMEKNIGREDVKRNIRLMREGVAEPVPVVADGEPPF